MKYRKPLLKSIFKSFRFLIFVFVFFLIENELEKEKANFLTFLYFQWFLINKYITCASLSLLELLKEKIKIKATVREKFYTINLDPSRFLETPTDHANHLKVQIGLETPIVSKIGGLFFPVVRANIRILDYMTFFMNVLTGVANKK